MIILGLHRAHPLHDVGRVLERYPCDALVQHARKLQQMHNRKRIPMPIIGEIAQTMQEALTNEANQAGRTSGFVQREWKSHGTVDESRSQKPYRVRCDVSAKLLAMVVQHGLFLVNLWNYPDRSLVKAAKTIQRRAMELASSFRRRSRLIETITRMGAGGSARTGRQSGPPWKRAWSIRRQHELANSA